MNSFKNLIVKRLWSIKDSLKHLETCLEENYAAYNCTVNEINILKSEWEQLYNDAKKYGIDIDQELMAEALNLSYDQMTGILNPTAITK